jgi:hypothetical protein
MNNLDYDHIPVPINKDQRTIFENADRKIMDICKRILGKQDEGYRFLKALFDLSMAMVYGMIEKSCVEALGKYAQEPRESRLGFREMMPLTDRSIGLDDMCNGCDEWCPRDAIHRWIRAFGVKYHHPSIKLIDMIVPNR